MNLSMLDLVFLYFVIATAGILREIHNCLHSLSQVCLYARLKFKGL